MATTRKSSRFAFVNYTGQPDQDAKQTLPVVRRHVMNDFFRQKREAEGLPYAPVQSQRQSKRRGGRKRHASEKVECRNEDSAGDPPQAHNANASPDGRGQSSQPFSHDHSPNSHLVPIRAGSNFSIEDLEAHRLDPFDALPIEGSPEVEDLARWHFGYGFSVASASHERWLPWIRVADAAWRDSFWKIALGDAALFHILLCIAVSKRGAITGRANDAEYYFHKGRALRIVRDQLIDRAQVPGESTVVLMTTAASLAIKDHDREASDAHMNAVQRLVAAKGGLATFAEAAYKSVLWIDLRLAATGLRSPMLPYCPRNDWIALPADLIRRARTLALHTLPKSPATFDYVSAHDLFYGLHQMSLAYDVQYASQADAWAVQNAFYRTGYQICLMTSYICQEPHEHHQQAARAPVSPYTSVESALVLAAQMFVWATLRRAPLMSHIEAIPLYHLYNHLNQQQELLSCWAREASLEALLWVLFLGTAAALNVPQKRTPSSQPVLPWFLENIRNVTSELEIVRLEEFELTLRYFPWTEHFSRGNCVLVWHEMGSRQTLPSEDSMRGLDIWH
ncbi:hypothetical protein LTR66_003704 [Elasticomyces elasticus]|nr:hypothetical protein LTR66_003704 [Elasticomyces elasticus]